MAFHHESPYPSTSRSPSLDEDSQDTYLLNALDDKTGSGMRSSGDRPWRVQHRRRSFRTCSPQKCCSIVRLITRHPLFPSHPLSLLFAFLLLAIFGTLLTLFLMYVLNPDKEPLPWRTYCVNPSMDNLSFPLSPAYLVPNQVAGTYVKSPPSFSPEQIEGLPPAGIFLGVFTIDSAVEKRMLIRTTWAKHVNSRNGAWPGDGGHGTSRMLVRFIMGRPRPGWEAKVRLESMIYNDIVILPIVENMNSGKTHAYFTWASTDAWVPPLPLDMPHPTFSYQQSTLPGPPPRASHDPPAEVQERPWVRPDYVLKVDDDAFIMLAELESRLRFHLYHNPSGLPISHDSSVAMSADSDPLVYWGYLVKNQFMGGELYGLSWSLVSWAARDLTVRTMTKGKEDKQVAKWMRHHPRASKIAWVSETCWIYDHPRAGTVYSHGFLFPSEVSKIQENVSWSRPDTSSPADSNPSRTTWAYSSVSTFGLRYTPPLSNLTTPQTVEALVEGSEMSLLRDGQGSAEAAWRRRLDRDTLYNHRRLGGTVAVHFIKKDSWYLETAIAMLGADTSYMKALSRDHDP